MKSGFRLQVSVSGSKQRISIFKPTPPIPFVYVQYIDLAFTCCTSHQISYRKTIEQGSSIMTVRAMDSSADSSPPRSESRHSQEPSSGTTRNSFIASLRSSFRNSLSLNSEPSPVKSPQSRPATSQEPEAFKVSNTPRERSGSKVFDINAAIIAQYEPSLKLQKEMRVSSPVAAPNSTASTAPAPTALPYLLQAQIRTSVAATEVTCSR